MDRLIEMMIPFKVRPLSLPEDVEVTTVEDTNAYKAALEHRVVGKVWTAVAIRPNPPIRWEMGIRGYIHESFILRIKETQYVSHTEPIPCMLLLLVREGENPIWWPDKYCEAIGG